jgi:hypothetical protein
MSRTKIVFAAVAASVLAIGATASATDAKLFNNRNVLTSGKQFVSMKGFSNYASLATSLKGNIKTYSGGNLFANSSVLGAGKSDPAAAAKFAKATNGSTALTEGLASRSLVTGSTTGK